MPSTIARSRLRCWSRRLATAVAAGLGMGAALWLIGDFRIIQRVLDGVERRALAHQSTIADHYGLRLLYATLQMGGRVVYPQAAEYLAHYCEGQGDTLRFDARPLLRHPDVQQALQLHKPGITFRHQRSAGPFYIVRHTDWALYYAFDLLYIKREATGVAFYDNYFFQPLARRSYTRFNFGRVHCRLNDGLIRVAYPQAKSFVLYGEVTNVRAAVVAATH